MSTEPLSYLLTFTQDRWTTAEFAELPRVRTLYGDAVAAAAEKARFADLAALDVPDIGQVRATLREVARQGKALPLHRVDCLSDAFLQAQSVEAYGTPYWERLPEPALLQCAAAAADAATQLRMPVGRPSNLKVLSSLVSSLLEEWDRGLAKRELQRIKGRRERRGRTVNSEEQRRDDQVKLGRAKRRMLRLVLGTVGVPRASTSYLEKLERAARGIL